MSAGRGTPGRGPPAPSNPAARQRRGMASRPPLGTGLPDADALATRQGRRAGGIATMPVRLASRSLRVRRDRLPGPTIQDAHRRAVRLLQSGSTRPADAGRSRQPTPPARPVRPLGNGTIPRMRMPNIPPRVRSPCRRPGRGERGRGVTAPRAARTTLQTLPSTDPPLTTFASSLSGGNTKTVTPGRPNQTSRTRHRPLAAEAQRWRHHSLSGWATRNRPPEPRADCCFRHRRRPSVTCAKATRGSRRSGAVHDRIRARGGVRIAACAEATKAETLRSLAKSTLLVRRRGTETAPIPPTAATDTT